MTNIAQRSFGFGELSPSFYGRTDLGMYAQGLRTCRNAYVMRTGGVQNRPGTEYHGSTKVDGEARLIDCVFDEDQNYLLEFGPNYLRIWKDGVNVAPNATAWANATPYENGDSVTNSGSTYVAKQDHTSNAAVNEPGAGSNWTTFWTLLSEADKYEIVSPYTSIADMSARRPFTTASTCLRWTASLSPTTTSAASTLTPFPQGPSRFA